MHCETKRDLISQLRNDTCGMHGRRTERLCLMARTKQETPNVETPNVETLTYTFKVKGEERTGSIRRDIVVNVAERFGGGRLDRFRRSVGVGEMIASHEGMSATTAHKLMRAAGFTGVSSATTSSAATAYGLTFKYASDEITRYADDDRRAGHDVLEGGSILPDVLTIIDARLTKAFRASLKESCDPIEDVSARADMFRSLVATACAGISAARATSDDDDDDDDDDDKTPTPDDVETPTPDETPDDVETIADTIARGVAMMRAIADAIADADADAIATSDLVEIRRAASDLVATIDAYAYADAMTPVAA